jgi:osmotically-inducible protein OsmY
MIAHPLPCCGQRRTARDGWWRLPVALLAASLGLCACSPHEAQQAGQQVKAAVAQGAAEVDQGARQAKLTTEHAAVPDDVAASGAVPASAALASPSAAASRSAPKVDAVALRATQALVQTADLVANEVQDAGITARIHVEMDNDATLQGLRILVDTRDGDVLLHGQVPSLAARTRATALARDVQGVKHVENRLEVHG